MVTEYDVVQMSEGRPLFGPSGLEKFTKEVETYLSDGWKLAGGISTVWDDTLERVYYHQAVIRETD